MNGTLAENEEAFIRVMAVHSRTCGDKYFTEVRDRKTLTLSWACQCGFSVWVQLSAIRRGKFGKWICTPEERTKMLMGLNGVLVLVGKEKPG